MASQGPNNPGTLASSSASGGSASWANPGNAASSDNSYAIASINPSFGYTHYLKATNFGFSIPSGVTINGIIVEIERQAPSNTYVYDKEVRIVKSDGTISTTNRYKVGYWPYDGVDRVISYGSSSDLWGESWAYSDINDADFGVAFSVKSDSGKYVVYPQVDHIKITVYYTAGASSAIKAVSGVAQSGMGKVSGTAASGISKIGGVANS